MPTSSCNFGRREKLLQDTLTTAQELAEDLKQTAVREADIVSCCTASNVALVMGEWLKLGAHLDLVGTFCDAVASVVAIDVLKGHIA